MDSPQATTHVSLCAGYGGIDLGLKRAIPDLRTIAFAEIEAYAVANLVSKMEAGQLDVAPVWSNLKTFPWRKFNGCVDVLSGGYPCQPFSAAGKRLGKEDVRHLWPWIADGILAMRPQLCFFENVEGHISLGLEDVLRDLQRIGYRCTFGVFSASEVGAPHQRKRIFILAHDTSVGVQGYWAGRFQESFAHAGEGLPMRRGNCWPSRPGQPQFPWEPPRVVGTVSKELADFCSGNSQQRRNTAPTGCESVGKRNEKSDSSSDGGSGIRRGDKEGGFAAVADAKRDGSREGGKLCAGPDGQQPVSDGEARGTDGLGDFRVQESRWLPSGSGRNEIPEARQSSRAMGDADRGRLEGTGAEPRRTEDVIGRDGESARRQTEPALGGDADGSADRLDYAKLCISGDSRVDELRLLGNGVVPATAERAFRVLAGRLLTCS